MDREQLQQWSQIIANIDKFKVTSAAELVPLIKQLAINFIDGDNLIVQVNDSILQKFSNRVQKQHFISVLRKNKIWGCDTVLFPFLNVLGYRTYLHLVDTDVPAYEIYEQKNHLLRILHIANHGAKANGIHWELLDYKQGRLYSVPNKADGDCMYWVLAQAIWKDVNKMRDILIVDEKQDKKKLQLLVAIQQKKIKQEWEQYENNDKLIQSKLYQQLAEKFISSDDNIYLLLAVAGKLCDGDAYVKSRIDGGARCSYNELLHVLSMEAWRNPKFYSYLKNKNIVQDVKIKKFNYNYLRYYGQHVSSGGGLVFNKRERENTKSPAKRWKRPRRSLVAYT